MKIAIDGRMINESGIGRYIKNLINELQLLDNKNEYFILLQDADFNKLNFNSNFTKVSANFRWYTLKEQIILPKILNKLKIDLVHFPHFNVPIFYEGKFVVTIHDLIHQHHATIHSSSLDPIRYKIKSKAYNIAFKFALKKSSKVITVSQAIKNQLINEWDINSNKIVVTYEAVEDKFINLSNSLNINKTNKILEKYKIGEPFILYVGNAHPHKNIENLIKSYELLKQQYPNLSLVLVGKDNYFWKKIRNNTQNKDIIFTGFLEDEELACLYKRANAYIFPTLEEGFGLPLLEAMAFDCPIVASDIEVLKEVGEDSVLYFNPNNTNDMSEKISLILSDSKLRQKLVQNGKLQYKKFSWKKLTQDTLKIYTDN